MFYDYFKNIENKYLNLDLPIWCIDQINNDLCNFKKNDMSYEKLEEIMKKSKKNPLEMQLVRFKIVDGKLYYHKDNTYGLLRHDSLYKISNKYKYICSIIYKISPFLNNVDFIISLQDSCYNTEIQPIFTFAKDTQNNIQKNNILIPDWLTLRGNHKDSWNNLKMRLDIKKTKFKLKKNKIVWRGALHTKYRIKFKEISLKNEKIIDYSNNWLTQQDHLQYKYQIVFDGCCCTWPGYLWRLYSGCLTIKHESSEIQWFYSALKPYVHYIPLKKNFTENDILKLYKWLCENEEKCQIISNNAEKFIIENMKVEDMLTYYINVINKYSEIQQCSKKLDDFSDNLLNFNKSLRYCLYIYISYYWEKYKKFKIYIFLIIISFLYIFMS